jgi:type VII secretion protein EccB
MASRKDQLNAYNFARKRTVAAFLQPSPTGSEEGAPRPLRALGPSLVAGALALAVFGAWGLLQPSAPAGWDTPGAYVIVGSESTTRYVVLKDTDAAGRPGPAQLHPVLNFASAKLLLDPGKGQVIKVKESVLDSGKVPHGATIGIPYAPDRLPSAQEAGTPKDWAVCDRPSSGVGNEPDQAVFVLAGKDATPARARMRLTGNQVLYVRGDDGLDYLVDAHGTRFPLGGPQHRASAKMSQLRSTLFGQAAQPQRVTAAWLKSLDPGSPIWFPAIGHLNEATPNGRVGTVMEATSAAGEEYYVVLDNGIAATTAFTALLVQDETGQAAPVRTAVPTGVVGSFTAAGADWPAQEPRTVDVADPATGRAGTTVACSVLAGTANSAGRPPLEVWAGNSYPATIVNGATSAYVTPGSGLLYVEVTGQDPTSGTLYLVTDTGLRYAVPRNNDSTAAAATPAPAATSGTAPPVNQAQIRLGYASVTPKGIPLAWSEFLPKGPTLDTESATRAQGS